MKNLNITVEFRYHGESLRFGKVFQTDITPFFGMGFTFNSNEDFTVYFENNNWTKTSIDYNYDNDEWSVGIEYRWNYPVTEATINYTLRKFLTWERLDKTDVTKLKELMNERSGGRN